jgi:hypothetical protein
MEVAPTYEALEKPRYADLKVRVTNQSFAPDPPALRPRQTGEEKESRCFGKAFKNRNGSPLTAKP